MKSSSKVPVRVGARLGELLGAFVWLFPHKIQLYRKNEVGKRRKLIVEDRTSSSKVPVRMGVRERLKKQEKMRWGREENWLSRRGQVVQKFLCGSTSGGALGSVCTIIPHKIQLYRKNEMGKRRKLIVEERKSSSKVPVRMGVRERLYDYSPTKFNCIKKQEKMRWGRLIVEEMKSSSKVNSRLTWQ
jgi:hypothetical protein